MRSLLSRAVMMCMVCMLFMPAAGAFSLGGGNFVDAITNVTAPLVGGPVKVGNETVDSIADGVNQIDEQYAQYNLESGDSSENVNQERLLRETRVDNAIQLVNRMYQLIVHTFKLVFDMALLAFLLVEMILLVTLFTRWVPMLFRKLVENTANFIRRRIL